jgi:hypothetical protein
MADNVRALVIKSGTNQQIPSADSLLVGSGIDASAAGPLSIGASTADEITIGKIGVTTTFPGDVDIVGNVNTVGGTTFTDDVTFQGNTTIGNGPSDTMTMASTTTVINDIAFNGAGYRVTNMLDPSSAQDGATKAYADLKLALTGGTMSGPIAMGSNLITGLTPGVAGTDAANVDQVNAIAAIEYDQQIFVAAGADPLVATGAPLRPFASISAAMAAITDALPTKRYAISVAAGAYTEASALNLKPNVFIIGVSRDAVRITAPSFGLDASFTGGADNRSGISNAIVTGTASFNFTTVTSTAGKLYFRDTSFNSALTLTGYNNATVQAQLSGCQMFAVFTLKGINVGVFNDNILFSNIVLNQGDFGGCPTLLSAAGGAAGDLTVTTTVNDFTRRCSVFTHSLKFDGTVTVDGPSSYLDYTVGSLPAAGATVLNGGNLVSADFGANKTLSNLAFPTAVNNPIMPATTNALNFGDWGKQWYWNFGYLHASTGTDCYLVSYPSAFGAEADAGKNVYAIADAAGLAANINGGGVGLFSSNATGTGNSGGIEAETGTAVNGNSGSVTLTTGAVSGTGTRGVISLDGRQIDANSTKIVNLANGVDPNDAVNKSQLDAIVAGVSDVTATAPLLSSGGATPDISIDTAGASSGDVLTFNAGAWAAAAPVLTPPGGAVDNVQLNDGAGGFAGSASLSFAASTLTVQSTVAVTDGSETLSLSKDSASTDAATLDIEAASSVTATITGGATYLLTPSSVQTGFATSGALAFSLDPSLTPYKQVGALTDDISFSNATDLGPARGITIKIIGDTVSRNITSSPGSWKWLGGSAPAVVEGGKTVILSIACFGSAQSDIVASWSYDGSNAVTSVTAAAPLASSGGATPDISLTGVIDVANGGTGVATITAGSLVVGDDANAVNEIAPGSDGDVLTVVAGAWVSQAVPAAIDYSVVTIVTAEAANTAVTVAGAAAIATTASAGTARVAGIVKATDSVKVLGTQTCIVESGRAGLITQGEPVYLSASEPGKVTDLAPSGSGEVVAELGIATAADGSGLVSVLWQPKAIVVL